MGCRRKAHKEWVTNSNLLQPDANKIVRSRAVPQLKDADMEKQGKTLWYFEHIPAHMQCFSHTVRR